MSDAQHYNLTRHADVDVLVVDDRIENLQLLVSILAKRGFRTRPAVNGQIALQAARAVAPDIVLLDVNMPGMSGYEVCATFKSDPTLADIPIIFLSAVDDVQAKVRAFEVGGVDYITKPFQSAEVLVRVETHITLRRQRHALEQQYQQERDHLEELNRLKDEFLGMVSHDLKNPITTIKMCADLLKLGEVMTEGGNATYVGRIHQACDRMTRMINDLLELARVRSDTGVEYRPTLLEPLLEQCVLDVAMRAAEKGITLRYEPPEPCWVYVDDGRIEQVFTNLLTNAIKYTPPHGDVTLSVDLVDGHAVVKVTDTGIGIPESALPDIFDTFYRVDHERHQAEQGNGLGLAIAKTLVTQQNGAIWVESTQDVGSTFFVQLKRTDAPTTTS